MESGDARADQAGWVGPEGVFRASASFSGLEVTGLEELPVEFHEFRWRVERLKEITPVTVGDKLLEDTQWVFRRGYGPLLPDPERLTLFLKAQQHLVKLALAGIEVIVTQLEGDTAQAQIAELRGYGQDVLADLRKLIAATSALDELTVPDLLTIAADQARRYADQEQAFLTQWAMDRDQRAKREARIAAWRERAAYYDEARRIVASIDENVDS